MVNIDGTGESMTTIYLIRHAEAEGNLFRRAQGHWNGKVTERGKKQIDALAERFKDIHIDAVYSSDLERTKETAGAILRGRSLELHTSRQLREIHMGVWEGDSWGDLSYKWPEQMYNFNNDPEKWAVPGCESFVQCGARMTAAITEIARANEGRTVAIVAHGMCIKTFLMRAMGMELSDTSMHHGDNTSVSLLYYDGGKFTVEYYNDNSHLGELSTFAKQQWWRDTKKEDPSSLRFAPLNPRSRQEADFYTGCYRDSWIAAHGTDAGFMSSVYLSSARSHAARDPESLLKVLSGDTPVGVLELDPKRGKELNCGWISLLYLLPEYRGHGLGVQLIGMADAYFFKKKRSAVRLHVAVTNEHAIGFYHHYGFHDLRIEPGVSSDQILMERTL